jgi:hypothetical protein
VTRRPRKRNGLPSPSVDDIAARLGARWRDVHRRLAEARLEGIGRAGPDIEERIDALAGESLAIELRLARTPAVGLAGIEAKIHVAASLLRDASARDTVENRLLASALRDLRRRLGR